MAGLINYSSSSPSLLIIAIRSHFVSFSNSLFFAPSAVAESPPLLQIADMLDEESTTASSLHSSDIPPPLVDADFFPPRLSRSTSFDSGNWYNLVCRRPSYLLLRYEQSRIDKRRSRSAGGRIESSANRTFTVFTTNFHP